MRLHNPDDERGLENVERVGFLSSILSSSLDICIAGWQRRVSQTENSNFRKGKVTRCEDGENFSINNKNIRVKLKSRSE